jgi:subfamily B ATP-binding cassette protein HlyB/CyaB
VLILDEATSELDVEGERRVRANMRQIAEGRTVVIIAHRLSMVRACDRIFTIVDGRLIETGTHGQLMARHEGVYARLWRLQFDDGEGARR